MSDEHYALSTSPAAPPPTEADYDAIFAAVMETLRGRWFLSEFARRNRQADTQLVLAAIERLEGTMRGERADPSFERIRTDIREMAQAIAATRHEIAAIRPDGEHTGRIGEATEELDQIVQTTEQATSNILAAAETIQETAWTLREQGIDGAPCEALDRCSTDIYLACSFQDLTGQRTRKVIQVLRFLEGRINAMVEILGGDEDADAAGPGERARRHAPVDTGLDQDEIDRVIPTTQAAARSGAASAQTFAQAEEIEPSVDFDAADPPFASVSATDSFMPDMPAPETEIDATALLELELAVSLAVTPEPALVEAAQAALEQAEVTLEADAAGRFTPTPTGETAESIADIVPQAAETATEIAETPTETVATAEMAAPPDMDGATLPEDVLAPDLSGPTSAEAEPATGERRGPPDTKALLADLLAIIRPDEPGDEDDAAADVAIAAPAQNDALPAQDDEAAAAPDDASTSPALQPISFARPSEAGALSSEFVIVPLMLPESELATEPRDAPPPAEDQREAEPRETELQETELQETELQEIALAEPPPPDVAPEVEAPEIALSEAEALDAETPHAEPVVAEQPDAEPAAAELCDEAVDAAQSDDAAQMAADNAPEPDAAATALADTLDDILLPDAAPAEALAPTTNDTDASAASPILDLDDDVLLTEDEPLQSAPPPPSPTAGRWDDDTPLLAPPSRGDDARTEPAAVDHAGAADRATTETAEDDETAQTSIADLAADEVRADIERAGSARADDDPTDGLLANEVLADDESADDERADGGTSDDAANADATTPKLDEQSHYGPLAAAAGFHAPPPRNDDGRDAIAAQATGVTPMAPDASGPMAAPSFGAIMAAMAEALAAEPEPAVSVGPADPLDAVRAMTAEERIALFS